jgi:hypothetical protein
VVFKPLDQPTWLSNDQRVSLGAYYTPAEPSVYLGRWAGAFAAGSVLDPSVGGGSLLFAYEEAATRLGHTTTEIFGLDIDTRALQELRTTGWGLRQADFLSLRPGHDHPRVDLVLTNPPYVRHQSLGDDRRGWIANVLAAAGLKLPGTASLWLSHLVHAVGFVRPGGALAAIVPVDLVESEAGRAVLTYFARSFASVEVHSFEERLFPDLAVDTVVLFATARSGGACSDVRRVAHRSVGAALAGEEQPSTADATRRRAVELLDQLREGGQWELLGRLAKISLGLVTGDRGFFLLTDAQAKALPGTAFRPVLASTADAPGQVFTIDDHLALLAKGRGAYLFTPSKEPNGQSEAERLLISEGQRNGVDQRYKCQHRTPWYLVPGSDRAASPLLLTYVNDRGPRLIENRAGVLSTNAFLTVEPMADVSAAALAKAFRNPLTLLSAELLGKRLAGGALRLDIRPAGEILVPWPARRRNPGSATAPPANRQTIDEATELLEGLRALRRRR